MQESNSRRIAEFLMDYIADEFGIDQLRVIMEPLGLSEEDYAEYGYASWPEEEL